MMKRIRSAQAGLEEDKWKEEHLARDTSSVLQVLWLVPWFCIIFCFDTTPSRGHFLRGTLQEE